MNTDKLFETIRQAPADIPLEKVEQFVIAHAAAGTFVAGKTSLLKKLALKFHLNTITTLIIVSAAATAITIFCLSSGGTEKKTTAASPNNQQDVPVSQLISNPENKLLNIFAADTPETHASGKNATASSLIVYTSGDSVITRKFTDASGTKITIHSNASDMNVMYSSDSTENDSNAAYAYFNTSGNQYQEKAADVPLNKMNALAPIRKVTCQTDTLEKVLEDEMIKDGLIDNLDFYRFDFTGKSMKVNGKRVDKDKWLKYKALIENNSDYNVNRKFEYMLIVSRNGKDIRVNNCN